MKIALISDLHGAPHTRIKEDVDVILAAGDIDTNLNGLENLFKVYGYEQEIIAVAGNHEFYERSYDWRREDLSNEEYLENRLVPLDATTRLLACTLWTDFELYGDPIEAMKVGKRGLNDFRYVKGWTPERSAEVHAESKAWLASKLLEPFSGKTIVMTHHCPSHKSISPKYGTDLLNACFASNLDHLFPHVDLWVHGHTHTPCDYTVGRCRVVCNPMGYRGENPGPYKAKIVEV